MRPRIHSVPTLLPALLLAGLLLPVQPPSSEAGPKPKPSISRTMRGPQSAFTTNRYRPRIRFTTGQPQGTKLPVSADFSTQTGNISKIEVRIDGKLIKTIPAQAPMRVGKLDLVVDLAQAGPGSHKLTLWAWQGQPGYQRLHGESKPFKFTQ